VPPGEVEKIFASQTMLVLFPHGEYQIRFLLVDPIRILEKFPFRRCQLEPGRPPARKRRFQAGVFDIMDGHTGSTSYFTIAQRVRFQQHRPSLIRMRDRSKRAHPGLSAPRAVIRP
jgi:hypothetical protein